MQAEVKNAISLFFSAIQTGKLYASNHPKSLEITESAFQSLGRVFKEQREFVIGIVNNELAWEGEVFFDLSKKLRSVIYYLTDRNIERIYVHEALTLEEMRKFISLLSSAKGELQRDSEKYLLLQGIKYIRTSKIKDVSLDQLSSRDDWDKMGDMYNATLDTIEDSYHKILKGGEFEHLDLRFDMLNMLDFFMGRHQELIALVSVRDKDLITYAHLCNVAILSMHLASRMGFAKDEVLDLGIAALFHDIGKIAISTEILQKKSKLDQNEFNKMREHPQIGAKILSRHRESLGIIPIVVAYEHHRRYDLMGYPKVGHPRKPHQASLIVSLCDVYDALAQRRTYKKDYPPNKIYKIMSEEKGKLFDPELFDQFFTSLGVWPIGSLVALNDGNIAVVRELDDTDIFRPRVEIISEPNQGEFLNLSDPKAYTSIKKALNPFGEGKKYLDRI